MRLTQPVNGYHLGAVSVALSALLFSTASAQRLTAVESVALADGNVELRYHFDRDVQAPKTFYLDNKNLLLNETNKVNVPLFLIVRILFCAILFIEIFPMMMIS